MPPFSRSGSRVLFELRTRNYSTVSKPPSLPKPLQKRPPSNRPTKLESQSLDRPRPSPESPVQERKRNVLDPRYGFAMLRMSVARSSATFFHWLRQQHARLPQPLRYTISFVYLLGVVFVLIVPPAMVFRNHFFDIIRVTGPSMSPYLNTDFEDGTTGVHDITKSTDRILLNLYRPRYNLRRGMVVAFRTPHDPEKWAIKRIVAMPGDRVVPLAHYPGLEALDGRGLIVPFGHIWVEGDVSDSSKKDASMDSNIYGPISTGLVTGKATHVITSFFSRWTPIDPNLFKIPERVQEDVVALQDTDEGRQSQGFEEMFQDAKWVEILKALSRGLQKEGAAEKFRENPELQDFFHNIRTQAKRQVTRRDSQTDVVAAEILAIVDDLIGGQECAPKGEV